MITAGGGETRIVVASPGDVQAERDSLPAVIEELNSGIAKDRGLRLEIARWETDAYPGFHLEGPQGLIDDILRIEDCDVLIGIFWKRFGTPTKGAQSGTEHEFRQLITAIRRRLAAGRKPKAVTAISLSFEVPTGALSPDSHLYIERNHDYAMRQQVTREGSTTIIEGARQIGKSSLVARALAHARLHQCTVIDFDFQDLDERHLSGLETLLRYLADAIYERMQLAASPDETWQGPLGAKDKLTSFIQDYVLRGARMPVVVVMDEVDRVFGRPYQDDFFALLRAWHNRRARDPLWKKLNLVLAYSTDPRQAIKDLKQSPFNVGTKIPLGDFSVDEMWALNRRYERPVKRKDQLQSLVDIIGGHPYLAQQALYALAEQTHTLPSLLNTDNADAGPFADHLQHYRRLLESEPTLRQAMKQAIINGSCPNYGTFERLRSLGLVTGVSHNAAVPRCRLYAAYFHRVLS